MMFNLLICIKILFLIVLILVYLHIQKTKKKISKDIEEIKKHNKKTQHSLDEISLYGYERKELN